MAEQEDKDAENERKYGRAEDEVVEGPLIRSKTISLNRQKSMEPGLASWLEEL
jgi:hypothetical protein